MLRLLTALTLTTSLSLQFTSCADSSATPERMSPPSSSAPPQKPRPRAATSGLTTVTDPDGFKYEIDYQFSFQLSAIEQTAAPGFADLSGSCLCVLVVTNMTEGHDAPNPATNLHVEVEFGAGTLHFVLDGSEVSTIAMGSGIRIQRNLAISSNDAELPVETAKSLVRQATISNGVVRLDRWRNSAGPDGGDCIVDRHGSWSLELNQICENGKEPRIVMQ